MNESELLTQWQVEEQHAFQGWDFSHLDGRWQGESLPWNYELLARKLLQPTNRLLDMGTGGGEFLLSLGHPPDKTTVTEAYPPNVRLCRERLAPMGIDVQQTAVRVALPFEDCSFDIVLNRHEDFDSAEVFRVLRPGGTFLTQQVGGENNRALSALLIDGFRPPFPQHNLQHAVQGLRKAGFVLLIEEEAFPSLRFYDIGALVFFAKIIEWEFPGFSVDSCREKLWCLHRCTQEHRWLESREHRFLCIARKLK